MERKINIKDFLKIFWDRKHIILISTLFGFLIGFISFENTISDESSEIRFRIQRDYSTSSFFLNKFFEHKYSSLTNGDLLRITFNEFASKDGLDNFFNENEDFKKIFPNNERYDDFLNKFRKYEITKPTLDEFTFRVPYKNKKIFLKILKKYFEEINRKVIQISKLKMIEVARRTSYVLDFKIRNYRKGISELVRSYESYDDDDYKKALYDSLLKLNMQINKDTINARMNDDYIKILESDSYGYDTFAVILDEDSYKDYSRKLYPFILTAFIGFILSFIIIFFQYLRKY